MGETQESVVHTPGPWKQFAPEIDGQVCQDYRTIRGGMGLRGDGFELTGFVPEADARLIAAAPELLACVLAMLDEYEAGATIQPFEIREMCRAAKYKARGESYD